MRGTAIGDRRVLADDGQFVTFLIKDYRNGGESKTVRITGSELVRRFLLHILPRRFRRIRYYGVHSARHRKRDVVRAHALLGVAPDDDLEEEKRTDEYDPEQTEETQEPRMCGPECAECKCEMQHVREIAASEGWRTIHSTTRHLKRQSITPTVTRNVSRPRSAHHSQIDLESGSAACSERSRTTALGLRGHSHRRAVADHAPAD